MGCICSKGANVNKHVGEYEATKELERSKSPTQLTLPVEVLVKGNNGSAVHSRSSVKSSLQSGYVKAQHVEQNPKEKIIERPSSGHQRSGSARGRGKQAPVPSITRLPRGEAVAAGWPPWLTSVAGEAVEGWSPRSVDSYEKLKKIGQGTYSTVYKARDLKSDTIVAMKKVKFHQMDPESVRFMAREISILRRLDHPNVMRLKAIVISSISGSLYLVFDYMKHDLAKLLESSKFKLTEPQIKFYMQQILRGLEHCHSRGILHRDIKGANILVDSNGALKIGDFGLATILNPRKKCQLTSCVVTLWYRAPELLLGTMNYGAAVDLWSVGCILAELFTGRPIMPGRTEVEQTHKIFKLCGSPTEAFWKKTELPLASCFRSQRVYKRNISQTFKDLPSSALALLEVLLSMDPQERGTASSALRSGFFTSMRLPCEPSKMARYPSSKEVKAWTRDGEVKRRRGKSVKGGQGKISNTQKAIPEGQGKPNKSTNYQYNLDSAFPIVPPRVSNGCTHQSNSFIHPNAAGYSWNKNMNDGLNHPVHGLSDQHPTELMRQGTELRQPVEGSSDFHPKNGWRRSNNDSTGYMPLRKRIIYSGSLMPLGGNMEEMLKEHERKIQVAVRKAQVKKVRSDQEDRDNLMINEPQRSRICLLDNAAK
ncbi:probable serine/threonine-protein kinase At1g54610 [Salvia splendens]|uniref:probable serine/threonine-protein kinase At1g54610 n=1 Tax=Salvia splendens TaxID=180675 RepID=UPI001C278D5F|nr:probable serine/threonine-protein kinase At1g54610 [Salvia splendens]